MVTLEQVLDTVMQLPLEQQEMLIEILHNRHIEQRREEIAQNAQEVLADFRGGKLKPQSVNDVITELRTTLDEVEDE
jgi:hypothetical protein